MYKKAIDLEGQDLLTKKYRETLSTKAQGDSTTGVALDKLVEPLPLFNRAPAETVLEGENGSYIVLGRDRPSNKLSGYGGKGDTQAASIDIVVGRKGRLATEVSEDGEKVWADPDFKEDAARIYLSQKTDVDDNFNLAKGKYPVAKAKSAIGAKADNIRLIAREAIKMVSGVDGKNSQGGNSKASYGIDLIANNDDSDMQPIPKGQNLIEALTTIIDHIDKLNGIVESFIRYQLVINTTLSSHTHASFGTPSVELAGVGITNTVLQSGKPYSSLISHKLNSSFIKFNYLSPLGGSYINSRHNNTS